MNTSPSCCGLISAIALDTEPGDSRPDAAPRHDAGRLQLQNREDKREPGNFKPLPGSLTELICRGGAAGGGAALRFNPGQLFNP
jgi:hypothetical protein